MNDFTPVRPLNAEQQKLIGSMKSAISDSRIKTVSFELFDTLVLLPFFDRHDIFFLMEGMFSGFYTGRQTFYELRCTAEEYVLKKAGKNPCITLDEIYDELVRKSKISPAGREKLIKRECELMEHYCFPRKCGAELLKRAVDTGKKIIITADTFLPRQTVEKIMKNCRIDRYDELYITGECKLPKINGGELFDVMCRESGNDPSEVLHFGGNFTADAESPIKRGMKSVFLTTCRDRLIKSGTLCGYIQKQFIYDFCTQEYLVLRCSLGLYSIYAFDFPHGKTARSDFCGDDYMIGFITLGTLSLYENYQTDGEVMENVLKVMRENEKMSAGADDFRELYNQHFGNLINKYGFSGCDEPFKFFYEHGSLSDRKCIQKYLPADIIGKWSQIVTEPEIVPVSTVTVKKNVLSSLADRLFPPNTPVRIYTEEILARISKIIRDRHR